jgi:hypothetical protein
VISFQDTNWGFSLGSPRLLEGHRAKSRVVISVLDCHVATKERLYEYARNADYLTD